MTYIVYSCRLRQAIQYVSCLYYLLVSTEYYYMTVVDGSRSCISPIMRLHNGCGRPLKSRDRDDNGRAWCAIQPACSFGAIRPLRRSGWHDSDAALNCAL